MAPERSSEDNLLEIKRLALLAARSEQQRLPAVARRRVLAQARRPARLLERLATAPYALGGQLLAAAALLALLALPAALMTRRPGVQPRHDDIGLQVRLQDDGSVVLEWDDGQQVHTVRRATSARAVAKVRGTRVEGSRFLDAAGRGAGEAQIVYYQVD